MSALADAPSRQAGRGDLKSPAVVSVQTKAAAFSFECAAGETILGAGLAAGFDLPYECATGTCGTCHARVMEGDVDPGWVEADGYRKLKREKGDILMCQAKALGPCALRVRSSAAQPETPSPLALVRKGRIDKVGRLTRDVIEFDLVLSEPMDYRAGQFVTLFHDRVAGRRAYSMVNFGKSVERLTFVLKRKPDGKFSDFLFDGDPIGCDIGVLGPLGRATFRPEEGRDFLCIAGGSGIAGMMAMLEHASDEGYFADHRGHVFFGVRTLQDAFYLEDFAKHVTAGNGGLAVTVALSDEESVAASHPDFPEIALATGMVHEVAGATIGGDWKAANAFLAGPPPMVDAAVGVLVKSGVSPQNIRFDKFS